MSFIRKRTEPFEVSDTQLERRGNIQANTYKANYEVLLCCVNVDNSVNRTNDQFKREISARSKTVMRIIFIAISHDD